MAGARSSTPDRQPDAAPGTTSAVVRLACSGHVVLQLHGELDGTGAAAAQAAVLQSVARGRVIILDLAGLAYLDCAALRALASARATARRAGSNVLLAAPQLLVRRLLSVAGADDEFIICDSLAAAQHFAATVYPHPGQGWTL